MKMLEPAVTCLLTVHLKPSTGDALASLVAQTRLRDVQVLVLDSGAWLDPTIKGGNALRSLHTAYSGHPNIEWVFTGESDGHAETICPCSYWVNRAIASGLARGRYLCTFYDDDLYYPAFFEQMAGRLDASPEIDAVWCTEVVSRLKPDGSREVLHEIRADHVRRGPTFDCQVDGMQVMYRRSALDRLTPPWMPEEAESCWHQDGLFYNRLSTVIDGVHPVDHPLCEHRRTPWSTFTNHTI